jgi:hypothetical protein
MKNKKSRPMGGFFTAPNSFRQKVAIEKIL